MIDEPSRPSQPSGPSEPRRVTEQAALPEPPTPPMAPTSVAGGGTAGFQAAFNDRRRRKWLVVLGLFGAALLYGDGIITPAISVLGAMEGLEIAAPHLPSVAIVAGTVVILLALFGVQRFGTSRVGGMFGPVMLVWFSVIATLGAMAIAREPAILGAANPWWAVRFFSHHGVAGYLVLGAVTLAVTGDRKSVV